MHKDDAKTNGHWGHLCSILLPLLPLRMLLLHSSKEDAKNRRYAPVAKMHMSKDDAKTERAICSCGENAHEQRRCKKRRPLRPLVKIICEALDVRCCCHSCHCECCYCTVGKRLQKQTIYSCGVNMSKDDAITDGHWGCRSCRWKWLATIECPCVCWHEHAHKSSVSGVQTTKKHT